MIWRDNTLIERPINILIGLALIRTPLFNMCEAFGYSGLNGDVLMSGFYLLYGLVLIISIYKIIKYKFNFYDIFTISVVTILIYLWILISNASSYIEENITTFVCFMIIPFICTTIIKGRHQQLWFLKISIFIHYLLGCVTAGIFIASGQYYGVYAMMATYTIAIPTSYYCYILFRSSKNRIIHSILSLAGIILMFFTGSRGGFLLIIFAFILGLRNIKNKNDYKFILKLALLLVLIGCIYINQLIDLLQGTRFLDTLEGGDITAGGGRDEVYSNIYNAIAENPIFGLGLWGDRTVLNGAYSHNLFLELWCDFGIVIGTIVILLFLYKTIEFVFVKQNTIVTILFLMAIPQLLVSNSYLISCYFWIYIGSLVSFSNTNSNTNIPLIHLTKHINI